MILTCPDCGTQYVVKDGAIPPEGRQVRCAACKHSWHQDPQIAEPAADPHLGSVPEPDQPQDNAAFDEAGPDAEQDESLTEATLIDPRSGPEAEQRAYEEAVVEGDAVPPDSIAEDESITPAAAPAVEDWKEPPEAEASPDMFSPFAADDELEPRRRSALSTIIIVALVILVVAALFWFLAPLDLKARLGLTAAGTSPLALVTTHMDRQRLESGNELLTVTGRVINPTAKEQDVPPIQAQLKNRGGKVVYSWTIQPPAKSLPAGASASFNSAEVNVPSGGDELTITLGEPAA
jgi:predicted Zn finger-like uncharacterized protein